MPDILLIQPPIQDFYLTAKRTMPYGLACVAAPLRRAGFSVGILDGLATTKSRRIPWPEGSHYLQPHYGRPDRSPFALFHHFRHFGYSIQHLSRQAANSGAWLIGISSLFSAYADTAMETAAAVKKACPDAVIVLGGHHPTTLPETVMAHPAVDYVLRGDGETGLPLLAQALKSRAGLQHVPGLVFRRPDGTTAINPPEVVRQLDDTPVPAFDLIHWPFYQRSGKGSLSITASRGCPLRCTYCAVNASSYHGYRRRTVQSVMTEIKAADDIAPLGFIDFEDEHLTADRQWFMTLMAALRHHFGERRPELRAMNGLFAPSLDEEVIAAMRTSGFKTLNLALITTQADQLKRFGRPDITAELDRVLTLAARHHLNSVVYLIVAGPSQSALASLRDLLFLARRRVLAGVSVFYPAPGSADYYWCERNGLLPPRPGLMRASMLPLAHATDRRQAATLLRLGRLLNYMKSLLDEGLTLPSPAPAPIKIPPHIDRSRTGQILLSAFLHDGLIRGVDTTGEVYPHPCDPKLTRTFIEGLRQVRLEGSRSGF